MSDRYTIQLRRIDVYAVVAYLALAPIMIRLVFLAPFDDPLQTRWFLIAQMAYFASIFFAFCAQTMLADYLAMSDAQVYAKARCWRMQRYLTIAALVAFLFAWLYAIAALAL